MNLNETIIKIRVDLQNSKLKKSGVNKFAGFKYYELADFLPKLNELMLENGVNDLFTIEENKATLILKKKEESQEYSIPFKIFNTPLNKSGQPSMQDIQYLGALNTYYKRYLYLNAFGITDGEIIDGMNNDDTKTKSITNEPKATEKQIDMLEDLLTDEETKKMLDYCKVEKIEDMTITQASTFISRKKGK